MQTHITEPACWHHDLRFDNFIKWPKMIRFWNLEDYLPRKNYDAYNKRHLYAERQPKKYKGDYNSFLKDFFRLKMMKKEVSP